MKKDREQQASKFLSLVLRHKPEEIGIFLDAQGWTNVQTLLHQLANHNSTISLSELESIVENSDKRRFAFNDNHTRIRASQGHSIEIELGYTAKKPPGLLYHGTATRFLDSILADGLRKESRHHVHLSPDADTAHNVGSRHGKPIVLTIQSADMATQGYLFYQSENGVWLTEAVPKEFITYESSKSE